MQTSSRSLDKLRVDITSIYEKLTENNNQILNWLCRKYYVRCAISQLDNQWVLHLISWKDLDGKKGFPLPKRAMEFIEYMRSYTYTPWLIDVDITGFQTQRNTYLFIDGSNISAAVKNRFHIQVDYAMILETIAFQSPRMVHKEVVESFLSHYVDKREEMWDRLGVVSTILPVKPGEKEEIVDELLHEAMMDQLRSTPFSSHLVLLSGDGNWNYRKKKCADSESDSEDDNGNDSEPDSPSSSPSSFPKVIEMALDIGWTVDVWSMKHSCSKTWIAFQKKYPGKFRLQYVNTLLRDCVFPMDLEEAESMAHLAKKRSGHMESILFPPP